MSNLDPSGKDTKVASTAKETVLKRPFWLRLKLQDQILFITRLSLMLRSGIPILQSIKLLKDQAGNASSKYIFSKMATLIENGSSLSLSMKEFTNIFGNFVINIMQIGDTSGTLEKNLEYLSEELKKRQALKRKIVGALIYPAVIIVATVGITGVLTMFVFPKVLPIFKNLAFDVPWTTKVLIWASDFALSYWWLIIILTVVFGVSFSFLMKVEKIRLRIDRLVLYTPAIGVMIQSYHLANFCRALGLLLKSEIGIVQAADITAQTTSNLAYREQAFRIKSTVTTGEKVSDVMKGDKFLFPDVLTQMVDVGESTGNLSQSLFFLADMYAEEVDDKAQNLSTVLEPALMLFMGALVGFIAIAIITPIYEVTQHLNPK